MSGSSTCRSCQRPIVWARTSTGKNMPIDPNPAPDGNLEMESTGTENGRIVIVVRPYKPRRDADDVKRYRSHFVTCPDAAQHRRRP